MPKSKQQICNPPRNSVPWKDWFELFLLQKKAQGLADRTLSDYHYHIPKFFKQYEAELVTPESLKLAVMKYFADSAGFSPYTFNTRRKLLKSFFSWALGEGLIISNPMIGIKKRKEDERPKAAGEETLGRLLSLPDKKTFVGLRDYAVFMLTMDTGIRPSEVFGLKVDDVNVNSFEVNIPASVAKTRVSRSLPLSPITVEAIKKLIINRHPAWNEHTPLFCTEDGRKLISRAWLRRLEHYSKLLGVKVRPYALRHSFAVMFLRSGGNAFSLQRMMGHTTMTMTKRYVSLTQADLVQQHTLATPLNRLVTQRNRVRSLKH